MSKSEKIGGSVELQDRDSHRLTVSLEPGHLECKSVFQLVLGNGEAESEKPLFSTGQFVPLLTRRELRGKNRVIVPIENKNVVDVRGRITFPRNQKNGER